MTESKKFMFDTNNFNTDNVEAEVTYTEEQMVLAKQHSMAMGKAEGVKETRQQQEEMIAALLQKTMTSAEKMVTDEDRREVEKCVSATKIAMQIIEKMMPKLSQQYALPEIERLITQSFEARKDEPRIAVTVPTIHLEALKIRVDTLSAEKGYAGRVILLGDDAMAPTDCRVEWADGGAERLYARIFTQIETEITKALTGMQNTVDNTKQ